MDKSDDCRREVNISIGDIRKMISKSPREWALVLICDKLEEIENRLDFIEQNMNKDKIAAENGWK